MSIAAPTPTPRRLPQAKWLPARWIPYLVVLPFFLWAVAGLIPKRDQADAFAFQDFGRLPVHTNGRVQPLDSLARNSLLQLREKQTVNTAPWESNPPMLTATEWIAEMMMNPQLADTRPVFRIDNGELKSLLALPAEESKVAKSDGKHFTWAQVQPKLEPLQNEARRVSGVDTSKRSAFDQSVTKLWNGVGIYMRLQNLLQPQNAKNWGSELQFYLTNVKPGFAAMVAQNEKRPYDKAAFDRTMNDMERFNVMKELETPLLIPPIAPVMDAQWQRSGEVLIATARSEPLPPAVTYYSRMADAFKTGRPALFNQAVVEYRNWLGNSYEKELGKTSSEQLFNAYAPFIKALAIYIVAALVLLLYWFNPDGWHTVRRCAFGLVLLALAIHLSGLSFRMLLEGRPPVTNLYSSAIFIGAGACVLGVLLELFWYNGIGLMVASVIGFATLIIAHNLSLAGDTMEMMRAVLDSNFWLATHVVVVTLGYSATFVAGFLAILYIILGVFTKVLTKTVSNRAAAGASTAANSVPGASLTSDKDRPPVTIAAGLTRMVYAIVCFATLFSFVGTVLGGIWADQSWGRFWGWDVKENGALIIVLWNALVLHARWGGMVKERGLMNLVIGGNIVTAWSWFGVNMLGIGLHSYGFTDAAFRWLIGFATSQLVLIGLGLLPKSLWRSYADAKSTPPPNAPALPA